MRKRLSEVLRQPFYLWLLGVYPILHLYSVNFGLVIDHEVLTSLAVMLAATAIAFALTNALIRNKHKTALMLSIASICFSFSGHVYTLVFMSKSLFIWTLIVSIAAVFFMVVVYRRSSAQILGSFDRYLESDTARSDDQPEHLACLGLRLCLFLCSDCVGLRCDDRHKTGNSESE